MNVSPKIKIVRVIWVKVKVQRDTWGSLKPFQVTFIPELVTPMDTCVIRDIVLSHSDTGVARKQTEPPGHQTTRSSMGVSCAHAWLPIETLPRVVGV